jgi:hypothetical protein
LESNSQVLNIGADSEFKLFCGNTVVDYAYGPSNNTRVMVRKPGIQEGNSELDKTEWYEVTGYNGSNLESLPITPHVYSSHFIRTFIVNNAMCTWQEFEKLKHETWYYVRVRGVDGGSAGLWSNFLGFQTDEQPKATVIVIR